MGRKSRSSSTKIDSDLPYYVEYAKTGRSMCKICYKFIDKDSLRIATLVQNPYHDSKKPDWHHAKCFFDEHCPKTTGDIEHFDNISWDDQEYMKKEIEKGGGISTAETATSTSSEGSSRKRNIAEVTSSGNEDFKAQYAELDMECYGCGWKLKKGDICLSKRDSQIGLDRWHHIDCFVMQRLELHFFDEGTNIPGVSSLSNEDQDFLKKALPKIDEENIPPEAKRMKTESEDSVDEKKLKDQQNQLFSIRDKLKTLKKNDLKEMLEANRQDVPIGLNDILDALADGLLFGALEPCAKCGGQLVFKSGTGYKCTGNASEWALCENITQDPKRKKFVIPEHLKEKNSFLDSFEPKVHRRLVKITAPSLSTTDSADGSNTLGEHRPLKYMEFVLTGFSGDKNGQLTRDILWMGGRVKNRVGKYTAAVIATEAEAENMSPIITDARDKRIQVVSEDFVEEVKNVKNDALVLIEIMNIVNWGSYPYFRVMNSIASGHAPRDESEFIKSGSSKLKVRAKGGVAVDPESCLEDVAHVHQRDKEVFTATLGETCAQTKKNSFYKIQILKHDKEEKYYLFRVWGRIGTKIGYKQRNSMSLNECIQMFEEKFEEKTGNLWSNRDFFMKKPRKMFLMRPEIDHVDDKSVVDLFNSDVESTLKKPVQDLVRLIFDVNLMKKAMMEFEIDTEKMPLGKISKRQIQEANSVLSRLLTLVKNEARDRAKIIEETNKFYTLIPHNFGVKGPKLIETEEEIQKKTEMLASLLEIEVAYNLVQNERGENRNPLDVYYEQLNTNIDVLDRDSNMFKLIEKYVKNTHGETHSDYDLIIEEVYIAKRNGEESRFEPFKELPNRKLLWHGSRLTNFAGILSQGLRIAPPEAPRTGYMFGKGIYFADMVSKSANYCRVDLDSENPTGLLLLCDVALGNMYERFDADFIEKLPPGYHSTWARGKTQPDPEQTIKLETDVQVPCGPAVSASNTWRLDYNEFIIYDVAQVKVEYIVKMKFVGKDARDVCLQ